MIRILAMVAGLMGALTLSQFPEFSQQYLQRLSGAVKELGLIVEGFDTAASAVGQSREEALESMPRDGVSGELRVTMRRAIARYDRLSGDLASLRAATPLERLAQPWNIADTEIVRDTWGDFQPAVPATAEGAISAGVGFVAGWGVVTLVLGWLSAPFSRDRRRQVRRQRP